MAIQVTCPGCHKRFSVSDKFAGQKGPCPSCKTVIQIPSKSEEVIVHAPEEFGPKDAAGRPVLKPIARSEARLSVAVSVLIGTLLVGLVAGAIWLRATYGGEVPHWILGAGAALLGPPLAFAGYTFLRNDELEPYRGRGVLLRALICGLVYAGLWGVYFGAIYFVFENERLELFQLLFIVPVLMAIGAGTAYVSFDVDFGTGVIHYAFYLLVTVLLRLLMKMPPF
jgi:hypothetical protein